MGGITHAGFMYKKDGVSMVWRKLWFEVKGTRLTYFQREDDAASLFNRSVSKRGQIKLEEVDDVRRSQASDAETAEIEIIDNQVRGLLPLRPPRAAPLLRFQTRCGASRAHAHAFFGACLTGGSLLGARGSHT